MDSKLSAFALELSASTPNKADILAKVTSNLNNAFTTDLLPQLSHLIAPQVVSTLSSPDFGTAISNAIKKQLDLQHIHSPTISPQELFHPTPMIDGVDDGLN